MLTLVETKQQWLTGTAADVSCTTNKLTSEAGKLLNDFERVQCLVQAAGQRMSGNWNTKNAKPDLHNELLNLTEAGRFRVTSESE